MSEFDEFMEPSTGTVRDEDGIVRDEDAICCECNVSYEDDARNDFGGE